MKKDGLILQTKLQPPQLKGKILHRERLLNLLKDNLDKKLILIFADAGYGKTTLLAQLCAALDRLFIFYYLESADNDLATFIGYIVSGIQKHYPGFGQRARGIVGQTRNVEIIVGTFINEFIEHVKKEFYIILDDYHHLQQNKEIGNALDYLLRHLPANLHLIISSRSALLLNLAHYLAKQELFKMGKEQLQFNQKEIQLLLNDVHGLRLPDAEIERIDRHSEGWITAIQLILQKICAMGENKAKETLNGYIASGEEVFNYFAREVFEEQTEIIQNFLMKTSVLDWMNAETCNEILTIRNAEKILSYLREENLFISLNHSVYNYHHLWRQFLGINLERRFDRRCIRNLHLKAAQYFKKKQEASLTFKHLILSESYDAAARFLQTNMKDMIKDGRLNAFIDSAERLPTNLLYKKFPRILSGKAEIFLLHGKIPQVKKIFEELIPAFRKKRDHSGLARVFYNKSVIIRREGDLVISLKIIRKALALCPRGDLDLKTILLASLGSTYRQIGRYREAEKVLKETLLICQKARNDEQQNSVIGNLALIHANRHEHKQAVELLDSIINYYSHQNPPVWLPDIYGNAAFSYLSLGEYDRAEDLILKAEKISELHNNIRATAYLSGLMGKVHLEKNDLDEAVKFYEKSLELNAGLKEYNLTVNVLIDLCSLYILKKDYIKAEEYLSRLAENVKNNPAGAVYLEYLLQLAELKMAKEKLREARTVLKKASRIAACLKDYYDMMRIYYILTRLYLKFNRQRQAIDFLHKCLDISREREFDFYLIKECTRNSTVFDLAVKHKVAAEYIDSIISRAGFGQIAVGSRDFEPFALILKVRFLGGLEILNEKNHPVAINWRSKETKVLFCYLIADRKLTKDTVVEHLWPKRGYKEMSSVLHTNISFIRKTLKKVLKTDSKKVITFRNGVYTLNPGINLWLDVEEFEKHINMGGAQLNSECQKDGIDSFLKAIDLYHGDYLGDIYDARCENQRLYYKQELIRAIGRVGEFYQQSGDYNEAIKIYRKGLLFDEINEDIHRAVMFCLAKIDNYSSIIEHYERLKKLLKDRLSAQPQPETIQAFQQLIKKSHQ